MNEVLASCQLAYQFTHKKIPAHMSFFTQRPIQNDCYSYMTVNSHIRVTFISDRFLIRFENFPQTWIFIYERWTKYPILNEHVFIQDHMHTVSWATRVQSNIESIGKWYAYLNSIKLTVWMRATVQKKREKWLTPTRTTKEILGYWSQTTA